MNERDIILLKLIERLDKLEALLGKKSPSKVSSVYSGQTTAEERQALRDHIDKLERESKIKKVKPNPNLFKISQLVDLIGDITETYRFGTIQFLACRKALPSMKECDKKTCEHTDKNYVWVRWTNGKTIAYHYTKLVAANPDDLLPKVGKELSGRVGPWEFDAKIQMWKRDGSDKLYSKEEFLDIMYFETHPYAKDDAAAFIKSLKTLQGK